MSLISFRLLMKNSGSKCFYFISKTRMLEGMHLIDHLESLVVKKNKI